MRMKIIILGSRRDPLDYMKEKWSRSYRPKKDI